MNFWYNQTNQIVISIMNIKIINPLQSNINNIKGMANIQTLRTDI